MLYGIVLAGCRATQVVPDVRYTDSELRTNVTLSPNSEWNTAFKVGNSQLRTSITPLPGLPWLQSVAVSKSKSSNCLAVRQTSGLSAAC